MSVENQVERLEQESEALKVSYEQSASELSLYTYETVFSTTMNGITCTLPSSYDPEVWWLPPAKLDSDTRIGDELVEVTFDSDEGINPFAMLEMEDASANERNDFITTTRVPYNGGARWIVELSPSIEPVGSTGYYSWKPNVIRFVVKSFARGRIGVKMAWD